MLFVTEPIKEEEMKAIQNFFAEYDSEIQVTPSEETNRLASVSKYMTSLVSGCYKKSVEDIENTHVGNRITRKRNLQQVMRESFYHGANRFGNNFIA